MLFVSVFDALLRRKLEGLLAPYCAALPQNGTRCLCIYSPYRWIMWSKSKYDAAEASGRVTAQNLVEEDGLCCLTRSSTRLG
jgi:hypothetical protein